MDGSAAPGPSRGPRSPDSLKFLALPSGMRKGIEACRREVLATGLERRTLRVKLGKVCLRTRFFLGQRINTQSSPLVGRLKVSDNLFPDNAQSAPQLHLSVTEQSTETSIRRMEVFVFGCRSRSLSSWLSESEMRLRIFSPFFASSRIKECRETV